MVAIPRRTLLAAALGGAAVLATGCAGTDLPIIGRHDPDDDVRLATAASEGQLIAAYTAAVAAFPALAPQLGALKQQHAKHLDAVMAGVSATPQATPKVPLDTRSRSAALRSLRRLESGAARQRADACVQAADAQLVQLLARIGASESAHTAYLGAVPA